MKLVRTGKVKEVYEVDGNTLEFVFTDSISVFDKTIPTEIPFKGETLCRTAAFWFQLLRKNGIRTHFTELVPPNRMRVRKVEVIDDYDSLVCSSTNYLIPLEIISRHYLAGSMFERVKSGDVAPEELGFPTGHQPKYGEMLPKTFYETTTKLEPVDRLLTREEAIQISGLTQEEYERVMDVTKRIDDLIAQEAVERFLIHVDGKKEFGFDDNRRLMLIDTFGTADEDRWWDEDSYNAGEFIELSKESVRKYYKEIGYYDELVAARREGREEPEIPPLPDDKVEEFSQLYIEMFERITGESFR